MIQLQHESFISAIGALLVIAPHPDDEVLGCGWLMRGVVRVGGSVIIAWLTDGSASHGEAADRAALAARREAEAACGLAALGIVPVASYRLGASDGWLASFSTPGANARWLRAICQRHMIDTVVVTAGDDGHPDHRAAFALAQHLDVMQSFAYPVSARYDGDTLSSLAEALEVGPYSDPDKRRALACHASQTADGGALFPLSAAAIDRFCGEPEIFYPMVWCASAQSPK